MVNLEINHHLCTNFPFLDFISLFIYKKFHFETRYRNSCTALIMLKTARSYKEMDLINVTGGKSTDNG